MAAEKHFTLELATPQAMVLVGQTDDAILPAQNGEMEVLPGHQPVLTLLRPGRMVTTISGVRRTFYLSGGYAEILPDRIVILADDAEEVEAIDPAEARQRLQNAEQQLDAHRLDPVAERELYQLAYQEAEARTRLSGTAAHE